MKKKEQKKLTSLIVSIIIILIFAAIEYYGIDIIGSAGELIGTSTSVQEVSFDLDSVPEFDGETPYVVINDNIPNFEKKYYTTRQL